MATMPLFPLADFEPDFSGLPEAEVDETKRDAHERAHADGPTDGVETEPPAEPATLTVSGETLDANEGQGDQANRGTTQSHGSKWLGSKRSGGPYPIGRLSMIMPVMDEETYTSFLLDMDVNGQKEPVWIWDGEIIDGKHREWACRVLGIEPIYELLPDDVDPVRFARSKNVERRHLTASQRALIGAELCALSTPGRPSRSEHRDNSAILQNYIQHLTQGEVAMEQGISTRLMSDAVKVAADADAVLPDAVRQGVVKVSDAVQVVSESAEIKRRALDLVNSGNSRTLVAGARIAKKEMVSPAHPNSSETPPEVSFGREVGHYVCRVAELVQQITPDSVDVMIARVSLLANRRVFSSIASLADHSLRSTGILAVPVHSEQLPEAVRRLTTKGKTWRPLEWFMEMDIVFSEPIAHSGEPGAVDMRRIALLVVCKAGAKFSVNGDVIEVPHSGDDNRHPQTLDDAMGLIAQEFARPRMTVCALSFVDSDSVNIATVRLRSQPHDTDEFRSNVRLVAGQLFGYPQGSDAGTDESSVNPRPAGA